ncbi:nuclear envelope phosphatase-regulatory subunit 1-like [Corticium candelabrum]|uniref:nuclear envelope phosphatase-regulatory subunit 1-like n=1 Tax=Corticium candelabrum TaxID=121492 RepID=UPI002E26550E|nr:nuclear envelope phosphatase-regulatory subunit 1-like [Corticium candelabrum]
MSADPAEDLRAFEQRLVDCVAALQPEAFKWKVLLIVLIVWNVMTGLGWLVDANGNMGFLESLWHHKAFSCGLILLFVLLVTNQYQKALAPQIVMARCRSVLKEYNMSCDENGRLILKKQRLPHPVR